MREHTPFWHGRSGGRATICGDWTAVLFTLRPKSLLNARSSLIPASRGLA